MEATNEIFDARYVRERLDWIKETEEPLMKCMYVSEILTYVLRFPELVETQPHFMLVARQKCREFETSINSLVLNDEMTLDDALRFGETIRLVYDMTADLAPFDCEEDTAETDSDEEKEEKEEKAGITWRQIREEQDAMIDQWEKEEDELADLEYDEQLARWDEGKDKKDFIDRNL